MIPMTPTPDEDEVLRALFAASDERPVSLVIAYRAAHRIKKLEEELALRPPAPREPDELLAFKVWLRTPPPGGPRVEGPHVYAAQNSMWSAWLYAKAQCEAEIAELTKKLEYAELGLSVCNCETAAYYEGMDAGVAGVMHRWREALAQPRSSGRCQAELQALIDKTHELRERRKE